MAYTAFFNEMYQADGIVRPHYAAVSDWIGATPTDRIRQMREAANMLFHRVGITFAVYGEEAGKERLIPFDIIPRVLTRTEWDRLSRGLEQRVHAAQQLGLAHRVEVEAHAARAGPAAPARRRRARSPPSRCRPVRRARR